MSPDATLRIGLDYRPALFSRSGIARSTRELARALQPIAQLELFGHGWRPPIEDALASARAVHGSRLRRSRLPGKALGALARLGWDATRLSRTAQSGSNARRVFHWTDYVYPPVRTDVPVTMTVHDVAFADSERWHGERMTAELHSRFSDAISRAAGIVCPSRTTARMLRDRFESTLPITTIPFGIDHVQRDHDEARVAQAREHAHKRLGTAAPFVVMLGTLEPRKNHATALDAFEILAARGNTTPLLIVGSYGWGVEDVRRRLERRLPFPCHWIQDARDDEVCALVAAAGAMLYPSSLEGFGFPPLEALELGRPTIAGRCDALVESCGEAGIFVDGSDAHDIARTVAEVIASPDVRERQAESWRRRRTRFTWDACAREHLAFWKRVVERRSETTTAARSLDATTP